MDTINAIDVKLYKMVVQSKLDITKSGTMKARHREANIWIWFQPKSILVSIFFLVRYIKVGYNIMLLTAKQLSTQADAPLWTKQSCLIAKQTPAVKPSLWI